MTLVIRFYKLYVIRLIYKFKCPALHMEFKKSNFEEKKSPALWPPREGRHEPPLCRHEPPKFARQTEPPLCRPSFRYSVNEPPPYNTAFFKSLFLCVIKNFNTFLYTTLLVIISHLRETSHATKVKSLKNLLSINLNTSLNKPPVLILLLLQIWEAHVCIAEAHGGRGFPPSLYLS